MNKVFIPISIVVSGLIIAGAIYLTTQQQNRDERPINPESIELAISPITEDDHILGNANADIIIVEYSDFECPFCKGFHQTMKQIMEEYGPTGRVAWVYRHYPLPFHRQARPAAEASECVALLGGNEKFWEYNDILYTGAPGSLSDENLLSSAIELGIDESEFLTCLASDYPKQRVDQNVADGNAIAQIDRQFGTPYSILISTTSGVQLPLRGNQPIGNIRAALDTILSELDN